MINSNLLDLVGNTPVISLKSLKNLEFPGFDAFAKLESFNPTGSIKDRPAAYIIRKLLLKSRVDKSSTIIESSSGNFGIALAAICKAENIRFICVIDPNTLSHNEFLLKHYGAEIIKVKERDSTGGYLKTRIQKIKDILVDHPDYIWINQYANEDNAAAHYFGTGMEIYKTFADHGLDYVFISASSGGTISGVSKLLKEQFPQICIVAVDVEGSLIFSDQAKKRHIPGMGSSIKPELINQAKIDKVIKVSEKDVVIGCTELIENYGIFAGGSSGAVYVAAKKFVNSLSSDNMVEGTRYPQSGSLIHVRPNLLMIFPDRGERYISTIYNRDWVEEHIYMGESDSLVI